eukprot:g29926.t1
MSEFSEKAVACGGKAFASRSKEDMKEWAGGPVGLDIYNAKEELKAALQPGPPQEGDVVIPLAEWRAKQEAERPKVEEAKEPATKKQKVERAPEAKPADSADEQSLLKACSTGNLEEVKQLLDRATPVNVNVTDQSEGCTGLMHAAKEGHKEVATILVDKLADLNLQDQKGQTALLHSCISKHVALVELLTAMGANLELKNKEGKAVSDYMKDNEDIKKAVEKGQSLWKEHKQKEEKEEKKPTTPAKKEGKLSKSVFVSGI